MVTVLPPRSTEKSKAPWPPWFGQLRCTIWAPAGAASSSTIANVRLDDFMSGPLPDALAAKQPILEIDSLQSAPGCLWRDRRSAQDGGPTPHPFSRSHRGFA